MSDTVTKNCELCQPSSLKIHEFEHSELRAGSHQFFKGYCVLVAKTHAREPFELSDQGMAVYRELMSAAQAIQKAFTPWKLNYGSYGNQVPHLHWHIFPRYETDPKHKLTPWLAMPSAEELQAFRTTEAHARDIAAALKPFL